MCNKSRPIVSRGNFRDKITSVKKVINIRLFDEEFEEANCLCYMDDISFEQLFAKLVKEELDRIGIK